MTLRVPEHTRFADRQLQEFAEQTREAFRELDRAKYLDGAPVELSGIAGAGVVTVRHGLRRIPRGWLVVYKRLPAAAVADVGLFYRTGEVWTADAIELYATGACDLLRLWVF